MGRSQIRGLACIEQDSIKFILDRSNVLFTESIRSLAEDSSGYLWMGTADAGVGRLSLYSDSLDISFYRSISFILRIFIRLLSMMSSVYGQGVNKEWIVSALPKIEIFSR